MTRCECGAMLSTLSEVHEGLCDACQMAAWEQPSSPMRHAIQHPIQRQQRLLRQERRAGQHSIRRKDVRRLVTGRKVG